MTSPFTAPGYWLKGNLHTHTTNSDGRLSPRDIALAYRDAGYDVLAITDHSRFTDPAAVEDAGLIAIPGMECHGGTNLAGETHHIVALGIDRPVNPRAEDGAQRIVDQVLQAGGQAMMAHPYWHGCTSEDLLAVEGWFAIEVYNHVCQSYIAKGESSEVLDQVLARGRRALCTAVDDTHRMGPDAFGGWVMLRAAERTPEAVMEALVTGRYYSSSGPQIHSVERSGTIVRVRCSPARTIALVGQGASGQACHAPAGELIEEAEFDLGRITRYARVLVRDEQGRGAWGNPEFLE